MTIQALYKTTNYYYKTWIVNICSCNCQQKFCFALEMPNLLGRCSLQLRFCAFPPLDGAPATAAAQGFRSPDTSVARRHCPFFAVLFLSAALVCSESPWGHLTAVFDLLRIQKVNHPLHSLLTFEWWWLVGYTMSRMETGHTSDDAS